MLIRLLSVLFFMFVGDVLAKQKTLTLYTESFPPYNFEKEDQITESTQRLFGFFAKTQIYTVLLTYTLGKERCN